MPRRGRAPSNKPVVTVANPAREFAFHRTVLLAGTVQWRYQFIPENGATRVIESYTVIKPITAFGWFVIRPSTAKQTAKQRSAPT